MKAKGESEVTVMSDLETPWTAAYQAPPSMGFSRQEYWSGLPSPSPSLGIREMQIKTAVSTISNPVSLKFAMIIIKKE